MKTTKNNRRKPQIKAGDVLQIRYGADQSWLDYSTIREGEESLAYGKVLAGVHVVNLEGLRAEFRIVRRFMGQKVIAGSSLE